VASLLAGKFKTGPPPSTDKFILCAHGLCGGFKDVLLPPHHDGFFHSLKLFMLEQNVKHMQI
jgi:hypothetical protein